MKIDKLNGIVILLHNIFGWTIRNLAIELKISQKTIRKIIKENKLISNKMCKNKWE